MPFVTGKRPLVRGGSLPLDQSQYPRWLKRNFEYDLTGGRIEYENASSRLLTKFSDSDFWTNLHTELPSVQATYRLGTDLDLFYSLSLPPLVIKPFNSFLNKTYRQNFVKRRGDGAPTWLGPGDWYEAIDDIVRTFFVVKYLDGVETFITSLRELAAKSNRLYRVEFKANDQGYYAAHFYVKEPVEIILVKGGSRLMNMWVEIQVTTQLQEVLRKILHVVYERTRMISDDNQIPWQWRYKDDDFFINYLGHMLHNIEGLIMEIRRRQG